MMFYPKAVYLPGPAGKQGYPSAGIMKRSGKGAIYHSMEGRWQAALSVLNSSVQSSWHFSQTYDGLWFQHYPLNAVTWHGGCIFANSHFVGVENEGRAGEPLTRAQIDGLAEFTAWLAEIDGWHGQYQRRVTLWEHNEMAAYGAAPTACPSGRIPWEEVIRLAVTIEELEKRSKVEVMLRAMRGAVENNDMGQLVRLQSMGGVLPPGTIALKPAIEA